MIAAATSLNIQLPQFEGPLGLLLYLIRKEEMDIMDIQIHKITHQYLEFMKLMKELDLETAGEFIAMAATLIQIKSRMLLPTYNEEGEVIEGDDPRKELVQRLLEYQKYQEAAKMLYERPLLGRDLWARGVREKMESKEEEIVLEENALFSLISAYRRILKTARTKIHQVASKLQSIASRILEMKERLIVGQKIAMSDLIDAFENRRRQVLITFLSGLELGKMGFISLFQSDAYQEIYFEAKKPIDTDAISRVEEYDNLKVEEMTEEILGKKPPHILSMEDFDADGEEPMANVLMDVISVDQETIPPEESIATDEEIEQALQEMNMADGNKA